MLTDNANFTIEGLIRNQDENVSRCAETSVPQVMLPISDDYTLILKCQPPAAANRVMAICTPSRRCHKPASCSSAVCSSGKRPNGFVVPPSAVKQAVLTKQEVEDRVKFSILSCDQFQKCRLVNIKDVLSVGGTDLICVGCRKGIETLLETLKQTPVSCYGNFEFLNCAKIKMNVNHRDLTYSDSLYHHLALCKFRVKEISECLPRKNKTRCVYHSVNHEIGGPRDSTINWDVLWENTSAESRKDILKLSFDELKNSHEMYVKKHRFCEDCQEHLTHAFRLLFNLDNAANFPDFNADTYQHLTVELCPQTGDRFVCVVADTNVLAGMMERLKNQLNTNNFNEERHARSLDIAQKEIVLCIAMFIYKRVQTIVMKFSAFTACVEMLPHMVWLTFRHNLEEAVEDIEGQLRIEKTLKEIAMVDAKLEAQKERKKEKKRNKKNKMKMLSGSSCQLSEDIHVEEECAECSHAIAPPICNLTGACRNSHTSTKSSKQSKTSRRSSGSPTTATCSDGGYSPGESTTPRNCSTRDTACNFSRRKTNKSTASSSGMSTLSCSSTPQSLSPDSNNSSSPPRNHPILTNTSHESPDSFSYPGKNSEKKTSKDCNSNLKKSEAKVVRAPPDFLMEYAQTDRPQHHPPKSSKVNLQHSRNQLELASCCTSTLKSMSSETLIPQEEIDAFKKKHADFLKHRESIRNKIRSDFENKLKVGGVS